MSKIRYVLLGLLLVAICLPAMAQPFPLSVLDDRGQEVVIQEMPQRIVAIGALYAQIIVDLGAIDRMVGVADSSDNPAAVEGLASVGSSFAPSIEAILALDPDLVLGATDWGGERPALEAAGLVVLTTPLLASVSDVLASLITIGTAIGHTDSAMQMAGSIALRILELESETLNRERSTAAFLYMSAPNDPPYIAGSGSIESELLARAGAINVFADISGFPQVSIEELIARDPSILFTDPSQVEHVLHSSLLQGVTAVQTGRILGIPASLMTSTRVAEALGQIIEALPNAAP